MNEYDSNRILDLVKTIDYSLTTNLAETDCYVLNTCHIREKATEKVFGGSVVTYTESAAYHQLFYFRNYYYKSKTKNSSY